MAEIIATVFADVPERAARQARVAAMAGADWIELRLDRFPPLADLRDSILSEGTLTVCTQCAARRDLTQPDLLPGVRLAGAAVFVSEALDDATQALVY